MEPSHLRRPVSAAMSAASSLGLPVDDALVVQNSNKLALHLVPCDVLARVSHPVNDVAVKGWIFRLDLARRLAKAGSPVAVLEPRVGPRVYSRIGHGFMDTEHILQLIHEGDGGTEAWTGISW